MATPFAILRAYRLQAGRQALHHHGLPGSEVAGDDVLAGLAHEPQVEGEVVDGGYLHGQEFLGMEEVAQVVVMSESCTTSNCH